MAEPKLMRVKPQRAEFGADLPADPMERLVYWAHLAPSSHNAQPWRLVVERDAVDLFADPQRWLPATDRDRREMYVSLGCALESLLIGADCEGFGAEATLFPVRGDESYAARIEIARAGPKRDGAAGDLVRFMQRRHTSHRPFDAERRVPERDLTWLLNAASQDHVALQIMDHGGRQAPLEQLVGQAERRLFADPAYRDELARWIGQGALGTHWLVSKLGQLAVQHLPVKNQLSQAETGWLASAPHVALLSTPDDSRASQVRAGQMYLRLALMCESRDIRTQPVSAPLELPDTRAALAEAFGIGQRWAQMLFRLGYAEPEKARTSRRPLAEVMVREG